MQTEMLSIHVRQRRLPCLPRIPTTLEVVEQWSGDITKLNSLGGGDGYRSGVDRVVWIGYQLEDFADSHPASLDELFAGEHIPNHPVEQRD